MNEALWVGVGGGEFMVCVCVLDGKGNGAFANTTRDILFLLMMSTNDVLVIGHRLSETPRAWTCWPLSVPLSDFCHDHHCFIGNMGIMPEPVDPYQSPFLIFAMITTASLAIWESCWNLLTPINPSFWFLPWSPLLHWQYGNHAGTCWPLSIPLSDFCHDHHCFIGIIPYSFNCRGAEGHVYGNVYYI